MKTMEYHIGPAIGASEEKDVVDVCMVHTTAAGSEGIGTVSSTSASGRGRGVTMVEKIRAPRGTYH